MFVYPIDRIRFFLEPDGECFIMSELVGEAVRQIGRITIENGKPEMWVSVALQYELNFKPAALTRACEQCGLRVELKCVSAKERGMR